MTVFYIETSALLKKYRNEKGTEVVEALLSEKRESEVVTTSYFTVLEVVSVATRLFRAGTLTKRLYSSMLANVERDTRELLLLQPTSDATISDAIRLTIDHGLRAPDAIHLASMLRMRDGLSDRLCFVCTDARLNAACADSDVLVLDPEALDALDILDRLRKKGPG